MIAKRLASALAVVALTLGLGGAAVACPTPSVAASPPACEETGTPARVILTVGDSITEGATLTASSSPSYRAELGRLLDAACYRHTFVTAAVGGTTCAYWSSRIATLMTAHRPDIVLVACGTNDRLDNKTDAQRKAYEGTYRSLFDTILDLDPDVLAYPAFVQYSAGRPAAGCTTPPGPSPAWLPASEAIGNDARYRAMVGVIDEWGKRVATFLDFQAIPEGFLDQCGVHPTPAGYNVMGRLVYNTIALKLGLQPAPVPCGLTGRRPGGPVPSWVACTEDRVRL